MTFSRILCAAALLATSALASAAAKDYFLYVGTYTGPKSKGIYVYRFDSKSGKVTPVGVAAETVNPSFLAIHPNGKFLYAVSEIDDFQGAKTGAVSAFSIDSRTGSLTLLNKVASRGAGPCFVSVDKTGNNALVANYGSGSAAVMPIEPNGSLKEASAFVQHKGSGPDAQRQKGPHAHSINLSPDNRFAMVADLGLDQVFVYRFDPTAGKLAANDPPSAKVAPGSGPRHFTFDPSGKHAYVINEMKSTVTAFDYSPESGVLKEIQTIGTLPKDFTGESTTAEVQVHPSGNFLYGSNRGHDSITIFKVDKKSGQLTYTGNESTKGKTPRNFRMDPSGKFLIAANQNTDNIVIFKVDEKTGKLTPTGQELSVGSPVCIRFLAIP